MNRTLRLRRETLVELTPDQLAAVDGAAPQATVSGCIVRELSLTFCGSHCSGC